MNRKTITFIRHYAEMLAAMFAGMLVLGGLLTLVLDWGSLSPELRLLGMAVIMSAPMVAWMRYRGHGWAPAWEMTGSMFAPTAAALALLWAGTVQDTSTLLMIQHVAMFPAMLAVMLLRLDEYTGHAGHAA